jgi:hypothetical protein
MCLWLPREVAEFLVVLSWAVVAVHSCKGPWHQHAPMGRTGSLGVRWPCLLSGLPRGSKKYGPFDAQEGRVQFSYNNRTAGWGHAGGWLLVRMQLLK